MDIPTNDALANNKPSRKKKPSSQNHHPDMFQSPNDNNIKSSHEIRTVPNRKGSKRGPGVVTEVSDGFQTERLDSNSMPDSSTSGNEYRALRRKYLLLEDESFGLGKELKVVEDDIKTLEEEKLSLLDELVVLEGLVDPLDVQSRGHRLQ
ncbi:hypothetical protein CASFOL_013314 [Castilleja foliolosa]|uniref:Uncharacterized protein n=1 Tax=Castilleja foliolosa TaxID=1961234 RepID=A0ABD3DN85_9LAMI